MRGHTRVLAVVTLALFAVVGLASAQMPRFVMVGMGDSLGEGVQSGDASWHTQPNSYLNLLAYHLGIQFPLPYIQSNFLGAVGDTSSRRRINPAQVSANLAVSGATVGSFLREAADGVINREVDLVLAPSLGTQIQVAESLDWTLGICWIGNNDALSAALSYDALNASQMTPVAEFQRDFHEIVQRLSALHRPVIMANIPDIDKIGLLLNRDDLIRLTGSAHGLAPGDLASVVSGLLIKFGVTIDLSQPNFVLDPAEQALVRARIAQFNAIIAAEAGAAGFPVVDANRLFSDIAATPPVIGGIRLTNRYLGGLFSLDGVHPSNIGHALITNAFIDKMNAVWSLGLPRLSPATLDWIVTHDPFVDKDGDGVVTGRPYTSLIESVAVLAGVSGDPSDVAPAPAKALSPATATARSAKITPGRVEVNPAVREQLARAMQEAFGSQSQRQQ